MNSELPPCVDQTPEQIAAYYTQAVEGAPAVVRQTQGGLLVYHVTDLEGPMSRGRVRARGYRSFYAKTGKNCFHPKGQTTLVVPTPEVLKWAEEHPRGKLDVPMFRVSLGVGRPDHQDSIGC